MLTSDKVSEDVSGRGASGFTCGSDSSRKIVSELYTQASLTTLCNNNSIIKLISTRKMFKSLPCLTSSPVQLLVSS